MDWRDQGFVLNTRKHGETSVILEVFTAEHGRHAGVVRGGVSRKMTPILQPGMTVAVDGGISIDGVTAGRIGDSVVVTETGFDYITEYPRTLLVTDT